MESGRKRPRSTQGEDLAQVARGARQAARAADALAAAAANAARAADAASAAAANAAVAADAAASAIESAAAAAADAAAHAGRAAAANAATEPAAAAAPAVIVFPAAPAHDPLVTFSAAPPSFFEYVAKTERRNMPPPQPPGGRCATPAAYGACRDCSGANGCASARRPKCECYAEAKKGLDAIRRDGPGAVVVLMECGECPSCALPPLTPSRPLAPGKKPPRRACRPTQGGFAFRVDVRDTLSPKCLGVFALEDISKGAFVCEYAGQYLTAEEARAQLAEYDAARRRFRRCNDPQMQGPRVGDEPGGAHGHALLTIVIHARLWPSGIRRADPPGSIRVDIDATQRGNAARFINHSCDPNLGAVVVKGRGRAGGMGGSPPHNGVPFRVALFSERAIRRGEELCMSYGVYGEAGKPPPPPLQPEWATLCICKAYGCREWLPGQE